MLLLNFFQTFGNELEIFLNDVKYFFINIFQSIYDFFSKYMSNDIMTLFGIAIIAFLLILVFRYVINKR